MSDGNFDDDDGRAGELRVYLDGNTPARMRELTLRESLLPWARKQFAADAKLRSILVGLSQYWADEADDAVHADAVFSPFETPRWPHECPDRRDASLAGDEDNCLGCGAANWVPWHDNSSAIPAFAMFCHEEGSQDQDSNANELPYAIFRRGAGKDVDVEIVGRVVRGWLDRADEPIAEVEPDARLAALYREVRLHPADDGPRHVLADELQLRGDVRGEYLALALHATPTAEMRARAEALLAAHRRAWMGPLARVVPEAECRFARGFPVAVAAHWDAELLAEVEHADAWCTVESLRLLPGCAMDSLPSTPALTQLGPIAPELLARLSPEARLTELELTLASLEDIDWLPLRELPSLRWLTVGGALSVARVLAQAAKAAPGLQTLELRTFEPEPMAAALSAANRPRRVAFGLAPHGWPRGFRLTHDLGEARTLHVELVALDREGDVARLAETADALGPRFAETLVLHGSRLWTPRPRELAALERQGQRRVVVA